MRRLIAQGLAELGLEGRVPPQSAQTLERYGALLLEKNRVMNLTAITQPEQVARLHMLDCAALLNVPGVELTGKRVIDVGTGAGFPGMVLQLLCPGARVTLLDSLGKRLDWLREIAPALGAERVEIRHGRGEELSHEPDWRESFDYAVSRAVAPLEILCELCLPYVAPGGRLLAMKAVDCEEELSRAARGIALLGGEPERNWDYALPGTDVVHRVVVVKKRTPTPKGYPRRWTKIQKTPL